MTPGPLNGDITNPQSLNRYAYALNNPATLTDPTGLDPFSSGGVECENPWFADSHAECEGPGSEYCLEIDDPACGTGIPIGSVGGGGGGGWGRSAAPGNSSFPGGTKVQVCAHIPGSPTICTIRNFPPVLAPLSAAATAIAILTALKDLFKGAPWAGSVNVPIPVITPEGIVPGPGGPTVSGALHVPGTKVGCIGGGWWAGTPGERAVGGGPLIFGNLGNAKNILSGTSWSVNIQATPAIGFQVIWNSSGVLAGPTASLVPGAALSRTTSVCQ